MGFHQATSGSLPVIGNGEGRPHIPMRGAGAQLQFWTSVNESERLSGRRTIHGDKTASILTTQRSHKNREADAGVP